MAQIETTLVSRLPRRPAQPSHQPPEAGAARATSSTRSHLRRRPSDADASGLDADAPADAVANVAHVETSSVRTENGAIVVTGRLFRHGGGGGQSQRFTERPKRPPPAPTRRPARVAQMLAFAHRVEAEVERGEFAIRSAAARHYGLTTGRITQLFNLLSLAPDVQEEIIFLEAVDGRQPVSGKALEKISRMLDWHEQRQGWDGVRRGRRPRR